MNDLEKEIEALIAEKERKAKAAKEIQEIENASVINDEISEDVKEAKIEPREINNNIKNVQAPVGEIEKTTTIEELSEPIPAVAITNNAITNQVNNPPNYITKSALIAHLRLAKTGHQNWMSNVQILTRVGNILDAKSSIPVNFTACDFGKWYFGEGQIIAAFEEYKELDRPHQMIHDTYLQIFELYKKKIEGSIFNSEKKQLKVREEKSNELVKTLIDYSKELFENLALLENKIKALSKEQMDTLNLI